MNYKLIAVDLDGTLLKGLNTIPKKSLMALKRFTDAGGKIVISTGRAITSARKIANKIEAYTGKKIPVWVQKSTLYYRGESPNGQIFSTKKSGPITGVVKSGMLEKIN